MKSSHDFKIILMKRKTGKKTRRKHLKVGTKMKHEFYSDRLIRFVSVVFYLKLRLKIMSQK